MSILKKIKKYLSNYDINIKDGKWDWSATITIKDGSRKAKSKVGFKTKEEAEKWVKSEIFDMDTEDSMGH